MYICFRRSRSIHRISLSDILFNIVQNDVWWKLNWAKLKLGTFRWFKLLMVFQIKLQILSDNFNPLGDEILEEAFVVSIECGKWDFVHFIDVQLSINPQRFVLLRDENESSNWRSAWKPLYHFICSIMVDVRREIDERVWTLPFLEYIKALLWQLY